MLVKNAKLEVGMKVRTNGDGIKICKSFFEGEIGEISGDSFYIWQNSNNGSMGLLPPSLKGYKYSWVVRLDNEVAEIEILNTGAKSEKNMNIKEQFVLALLPEPQKSFRKVGITNGDNLLTDEGMRIYLSWRLMKDAVEFKKEIVDDMVAELEKSK